MKRRHNSNLITAGITGLIVVALVGFAVAMMGRGQAEEAPPLVRYPDFPPTPTMAPAPTGAPALAGGAVLFSDNFASEQSLANWQIVDLEQVMPDSRSLWVIDDGQLKQNRTANAGNPSIQETLAVVGGPEWKDYAITTKFYDQGNGVAGLVVRRQGDSFYRYRILGNFYEDTPKQLLEKVVDGVATPLVAVEAPGYELYQWHTLTMRVVGPQIQVLLNGKLVAEASDPTLTAGQAGLYTRAIGSLGFDDVTVQAP